MHHANKRHQAVPQITSDFNSLEDVGWYGTAYQLASYVAYHPSDLMHL